MTDCGEVMLQIALAGMGEQGVTAQAAFEHAARNARWLKEYEIPIAFAEGFTQGMRDMDARKRRAGFRVINGGKGNE